MYFHQWKLPGAKEYLYNYTCILILYLFQYLSKNLDRNWLQLDTEHLAMEFMSNLVVNVQTMALGNYFFFFTRFWFGLRSYFSVPLWQVLATEVTNSLPVFAMSSGSFRYFQCNSHFWHLPFPPSIDGNIWTKDPINIAFLKDL